MTCGEHLKDVAAIVAEQSSEHMCAVFGRKIDGILACIEILQNSIVTPPKQPTPPIPPTLPPPPPPPPLVPLLQPQRLRNKTDQSVRYNERQDNLMGELKALLKYDFFR